ncbi:RNA polymerase sigma factor [Wenzhouxiangella marina]|uniref:Uncharacterized protein n=1 Tax=Wenzhouxiangella marina TaxID=1579979 RepID=A0A0K0XSK1_9GAMM|nr:sigma-70 family RNA polymerase sigma factor [Wenzhouxiangella marina]AKS40663.1 hypothetical protein WM2015_276 [Wenzhouxiangella marina]MBB6088433.1 RNA polymerase sigma-70 factor (ECF subfamily) [Wenzhouxiangella marina]
MNFSTPLDEISLAALKKDCRRTQEKVYRTFAPAAWSLAVRLSGCEAQAWDAVQAGFVRAFERVRQLREPARFGAWLKRIIVNQVMDQHRQRFDALDDDEGPALSETPSHDEQLDLERALACLDPIDRSVVWLHDAEGMTHAEIAEMAGQTVSWSKSRLSRARARIRPLLDPGLRPARQVNAS